MQSVAQPREAAPAPAGSPALPSLTDVASRISRRSATVAVLGLGYVGLPLLIESRREGFDVFGVEADPARVQQLRDGRSYIDDVSDEDLASLGAPLLTTDHNVLRRADIIIIAVPTPLHEGTPDLSPIEGACKDIASVLRQGQLVILESTTYPGTTEELVRPILEQSGLACSKDFGLAYSPERIDPGGAWTMRHTPKIVAGVSPLETELASSFYATLVDRVVETSSPREAEMAKLIENTFRQVNVALVNELATIAPSIGVDIWEALDAAATKPFGYIPFWPGPGVGGHCIAIDPSFLSWKVEQRMGFGIGFVEHARSVNNRMPAFVTGSIGEALNRIGLPLRGARLLVLGLTYKAGVSDLRESPAVEVLERLMAAGADCKYHDPYVPTIEIGGSRHNDILRVPPGSPEGSRTKLQSVLINDALLHQTDCVVILTSHAGLDYRPVVEASQLVFDAVGVTRERQAGNVVRL
ncbi:MAG: nucleotide sugar dehydrogenase [Actinomycetota bacterium]|nr:nucleotide sugar dehydrogenase [Actinomycetota bacterium]